jgi:hypothetical protein
MRVVARDFDTISHSVLNLEKSIAEARASKLGRDRPLIAFKKPSSLAGSS